MRFTSIKTKAPDVLQDENGRINRIFQYFWLKFVAEHSVRVSGDPFHAKGAIKFKVIQKTN